MEPIDARIRVDCESRQGPLRRIWASIGYDEINWTYTARGKALYRTLRDLAEVPYHVRNHNALTSGNGLSEPARGSTNVYQEAPDGTPVYDWTLVDRIYDTIVGAGFRPVVELGFLPRDLVPTEIQAAGWASDVGRETYEADGLWKHPPRDYGRWEELCARFVEHVVGRFGRETVEQWHFEVWNEPNIPNYWKGTFDDYCHLYDHAAAGVTRALPAARIGGPALARPADPAAAEFLRRFLDHCVSGRNWATGGTGSRLDFVSFHTKGAHYRRRRVYNWQQPVEREAPSMARMIRDIRTGLETVAAVPQLRGRPVLVNECDPAVGTIYGVHDNPNFVVTNTEYYPAFLCALVRRVLDLDRGFGDRIAILTTWAFYMEGKRFFEGNRTLVTNDNVEKPIVNGLRLLGRLAHTRLAVDSTGRRDQAGDDGLAEEAEVDALAAGSPGRVTVLVWHRADAWWTEGCARVDLQLTGLPFPGPVEVSHVRLDGAHSNAYAEWVRQGRPEDPAPAQLARLHESARLAPLAPPTREPLAPGRSLHLQFSLPMFGLSLIEVTPAGGGGMPARL
jgi:xylan 1,4-beta-xylosidase